MLCQPSVKSGGCRIYTPAQNTQPYAENTPLCRIQTPVQNIHPCVKYTTLCRMHTPVQNIHTCAEYTPLCRIETIVQNIHPLWFNGVQCMMECGDGVLIAADRCTHGGHHSPPPWWGRSSKTLLINGKGQKYGRLVHINGLILTVGRKKGDRRRSNGVHHHVSPLTHAFATSDG